MQEALFQKIKCRRGKIAKRNIEQHIQKIHDADMTLIQAIGTKQLEIERSCIFPHIGHIIAGIKVNHALYIEQQYEPYDP